MPSSSQGPFGGVGDGGAEAVRGEVAKEAGEEVVSFGDCSGEPGFSGDEWREKRREENQ